MGFSTLHMPLASLLHPFAPLRHLSPILGGWLLLTAPLPALAAVADQLCHSGACGPCPLAGPKACPCGAVRVDDGACDLVVPCCGGTCGKLLSCGMHRCPER